jgi:hypothetical protein
LSVVAESAFDQPDTRRQASVPAVVAVPVDASARVLPGISIAAVPVVDAVPDEVIGRDALRSAVPVTVAEPVDATGRATLTVAEPVVVVVAAACSGRRATIVAVPVVTVTPVDA